MKCPRCTDGTINGGYDKCPHCRGTGEIQKDTVWMCKQKYGEEEFPLKFNGRSWDCVSHIEDDLGLMWLEINQSEIIPFYRMERAK